MDNNSLVGELIEKGQNVTTNAVKTTVSDIADSVSDQVGIKNESIAKQAPQTQNQTQQPGQEPSQNSTKESQRTTEMVRDFYSPSNDISQNNAQTASVTEERQLALVRQELHQQLHSDVYYQPLISYEHKQQEESKTDQLERQDKQELAELQQKEADKPPPLAVRRAQTHTEMNPGVAG